MTGDPDIYHEALGAVLDFMCLSCGGKFVSTGVNIGSHCPHCGIKFETSGNWPKRCQLKEQARERESDLMAELLPIVKVMVRSRWPGGEWSEWAVRHGDEFKNSGYSFSSEGYAGFLAQLRSGEARRIRAAAQANEPTCEVEYKIELARDTVLKLP